MAREQKLFNHLCFYYALKRHNVHGFIRKESLNVVIGVRTKYSRSHALKLIRTLISLGWIRKSVRGYHIASHDKVWQYFGYDTTKKLNKDGAEKLILLKILVPRESKHLDVYFDAAELDKRLKDQKYKAMETLIQSTDTGTMSKSRTKYKRSFLAKQFRKYHLKYIRKNLNSDSNINLEITMSSIKIAQILGLRCVKSGWNRLCTIENHGLAQVERNRYLTIKRTDDKSCLEVLGKSFFISNGFLRKQLPNLFIINPLS